MERRAFLALRDQTGRIDPFVIATVVLLVFCALVVSGVIVVTY